jgi:hypothetical protein
MRMGNGFGSEFGLVRGFNPDSGSEAVITGEHCCLGAVQAILADPGWLPLCGLSCACDSYSSRPLSQAQQDTNRLTWNKRVKVLCKCAVPCKLYGAACTARTDVIVCFMSAGSSLVLGLVHVRTVFEQCNKCLSSAQATVPPR